MSFKKIISVIFASTLVLSAANATPISIGGVTLDIPDDLIPIVEQNKAQIEQSFIENNVDQGKADVYSGKITDFYNEYKGNFSGSTTPFGDTVNGLSKFCDDLIDTIPNTQGIQNIYADAWIGKLIPGAHFGAGVNVGASSIDISSLKKTAQALDIDTDKVPDTFAFPTVNADLRLGGVLLPFDVGIAAMKFDSSKVEPLEKTIDPLSFDYYVIGGDFRYALLKGGMLKPKLSIGAGYYYTSGSVGISNDKASASMNFSSQAYLLEAQASIKLLFFIPFVGTKLIYSKTNVDWSVDAKWDSLLTGSDYSEIVGCGVLPSHFTGNSKGSTFHPQVFGGVGFDFFIMSATVSAACDIKSKIISGAVSARISW